MTVHSVVKFVETAAPSYSAHAQDDLIMTTGVREMLHERPRLRTSHVAAR